MMIGRGAGSNVRNKEKAETKNPVVELEDGHKQIRVQEENDLINHMEALHGTVPVATRSHADKDKRAVAVEEGARTYKRFPRIAQAEQSESVVLQVTGKKRAADVDDMCFDGELVKAKKSRGTGGVATEMVDAEVNNGMQRDNNAKTGLSVQLRGKQ
jgi:hypothetical protein